MGIIDTFEVGRQGLNVHSKRIQIAAKTLPILTHRIMSEKSPF